MSRFFAYACGLVKGIAISFACLLSACATQRTCEPIRVPVPVELPPRSVVQPIADALLRDHIEAVGPLSSCPDIAQHNLTELRACKDDKAAIRAQQGAARDE